MGVDFFPSEKAGWWRQDPISLIPLALGAHWGEVDPFVMRSADQFRAPPPPEMTSAAYTASFAEVKAYGGDGITHADRAHRGPDPRRASTGRTTARRACALLRACTTRSRC